MTSIRSKENFSWTKKDDDYKYSSSHVSLSLIITDIRRLERLLTISLYSLDREDLNALKKDICFLQNQISENISKKNPPSNILDNFHRINEAVRDKLSDIDKQIMG